ncbi:MAG: diacylglycerol kinase family lipid kinase [Clostridia bacterium]|nr:diacylglycerol kinase family lipid kinase [Clostridia bacterium]
MYHIVLNPVAGKKKALKNLEVLEALFQSRGVAYEVHTSTAERETTEIVRKITQEKDQDVIVLGGDGTLHEALNGIVDPSACRLGLIPSGTGNDFAETAGIPLDPQKAAELILDCEAKETDCLEIGGVRCMNVGGLGIDVDVLERCNRGKKRGKAKYLKSLIQSLFAFKGMKVIVENEGKSEEKSVLIAAACNGTQFGGGIKICPTAEIDDGKMDVITVDCIGGVFKIIGAFIQLMKGRILQYPLTKHFRCDAVKFVSDKPCVAQLDGELYKELTFEAKVVRGLKFYRP